MSEITVTPEEINAAYDSRQEAFEQFHRAESNRIELDSKLKVSIAKAFADEVIKGSNPQKRDAAARSHFKKEYAELDAAEAAARQAKGELDSLEIECKRLHALMRLMEIEGRYSQIYHEE
jgi:hypothetical protein